MKISRKQLRQLISEALEAHEVEEELTGMDPHNSYGLGYLKGKEFHNKEDDEVEIDIEVKLTVDQIRSLLLREFKYTGQEFDDLIDVGGGAPPPVETPKSGGGGEGWPSSVVGALIASNSGSLSKWEQDPRNSRAAVYDNSQVKLYAKAVDSKNALVCTLVRGNKVLDRYSFVRNHPTAAGGMMARMMQITNNICDKTGSELERLSNDYKEYDKHIVDYLTRSGPGYKGPDCMPPKDDGSGYVYRGYK